MTMALDRLISNVVQELGILRLARQRYARVLAPEFNCFNYICPDELKLSQIISDLLNPQGKSY